jgi:polyphosphate glucokinase
MPLRTSVVLNDADAAGIAEMQLGAGVGLQGMVIMITIRTGLGSGVFYNGQLIPNIELGRIPGKDGEPIEIYAGAWARKVNSLSWGEWGPRLNYFLGRVTKVFSPDHFILGGGIGAENFHQIVSMTCAVRISIIALTRDADIKKTERTIE